MGFSTQSNEASDNPTFTLHNRGESASSISTSGYISEGTGEARVRVTLATMQFIPDDTDTVVEFDTKSWDLYNEFDLTTHIFTAQEKGYYDVNGHLLFFTMKAVFLIAVTICANDILNNNEYISTNNLYDLSSISTQAIVHLNVGETIKLYTHQVSGTPQVLLGVTTPNVSTLSISKLRTETSMLFTSTTELLANGANYETINHDLGKQHVQTTIMFKPSSGGYNDKWINGEGILTIIYHDANNLRLYNDSGTNIPIGRASVIIKK